MSERGSSSSRDHAQTASAVLERVPFPVPDFDGPAVVFGAGGSAYLTAEQLGDFYDLSARTPYHKAASGLFYRGGRLSDFGLEFKPEIDRKKAMNAIRALLCSFDPKHEIKIGTVAYALREWCDLTEAQGQSNA